jgi:hypothetical protein
MISLEFASCLVPWPDYNFQSFRYAHPNFMTNFTRQVSVAKMHGLDL